MKLTLSQVQHVVKLANLPLTEEELAKYSEQLSEILDYVEQLEKVATDNIEPTFNVTGFHNIFRDDQVQPSLSQEEAVKNAQEIKDGLFVAKGIFEEN